MDARRCISEGLIEVEDSNKTKEAEKDAKVLKKALETLMETKTRKKEKLDEILSFHRLVEEVCFCLISLSLSLLVQFSRSLTLIFLFTCRVTRFSA